MLLCSALAGAAVLVAPARVRDVRDLGGRETRLLAPPRRRAAVRRLRRRSSAGAPATSEVLTLVDDLATQVRAGAEPSRAWSVSVAMASGGNEGEGPRSGGSPQSEPATVAWALPGEAPGDCLRRLASVPGSSSALLALDAAWRLCDDVGAPLADVLSTVAAGIRQDADVEGEIEAALAGPRSTSRLLGVLPVLGLGLGQLMGAHPVQVLVQTTVGRACAVTGLLLAAAGQWWARRLVARTAAQL